MEKNSTELKACPHCGKEIHAEADFCPHCTQSLNRRAEARPPRRIPRGALWAGLAVLLCAALAAGVWLRTRPEVYEGDGGVVYTDGGVSYLICLAWDDDPFIPTPVRYTSGETNYDYRFPVMLYISYSESDTFADAEFMEKVESYSASFGETDGALAISCTEPEEHRDYLPNAALVSFVDYNAARAGEYSAVITYEFIMKNGDIVRVSQEEVLTASDALVYTWEDTPLETAEQLKALLDELENTVGASESDVKTNVYIYLPPVVYDCDLELGSVWVTFCGSEENGERTTFTGSIHMVGQMNIVFFEDIDFIGSGSGVGLSCAGRVYLTRCTVSGWKTGVLTYGHGWSWMTDTVFSGNGVGLHFNDQDHASVSSHRYINDTFSGNGTAILLEGTGTDIELSFDGCVFTGNGVDFDNLCNQPLDISGATFD